MKQAFADRLCHPLPRPAGPQVPPPIPLPDYCNVDRMGFWYKAIMRGSTTRLQRHERERGQGVVSTVSGLTPRGFTRCSF